MNEAKFTPGPWELEERFRGHRRISAHPIDRCDWLGLAKVVVVHNGNEPCDDGEANARLIAAAPEMYEALKGCLALLQKDGWYGIEVTAAENVLAKVDAQ